MYRISVVMSCYNGEAHLAEAIDSVLNQSFSDFEFIIVDDGSTDNSISIIESYVDERIKIVQQENRGLAYSLNRGISLARGNFIARMDADDICLKDRFKTQLEFMEKHPEVDVMGGAMLYIDSNGTFLGRSFTLTNRNLIRHYILNIDNVISHPTSFIRAASFKNVGGFCSSLFAKQDYHLWNKILRRNGVIANSSRALIKYRILETSISSKYPFNRTNSPVFNEILSSDNPTLNLINRLKTQTNTHTKGTRNYNFDNTENKIYTFLKRFFSSKSAERTVSELKNVFAYLKKFKTATL